MKSYEELEKMFDENKFRDIDKEKNGEKFYYLRTISRLEIAKKYFKNNKLKKEDLTLKFNKLLEDDKFELENIENFIIEEYKQQLENRKITTKKILKELNEMNEFDWGGAYNNNLENKIIREVKITPYYNKLKEKIEKDLSYSLKGYTLNSWYNHWSSILIEDIFKQHEKVLPTVGLIKKIDFFIERIPFDLKVTYFPEEFMKEKLKEKHFGIELTKVKQMCKSLSIEVKEEDKTERALNIQLQGLLKENDSEEAKQFLNELNELKKEIIEEAINDPVGLIKFLYEKQGERRFDASNRFFLILIDENNYFESWKLKRNFKLLEKEITKKLDSISKQNIKEINFCWEKEKNIYRVKSEILFIVKK